LFIPQRQKRLKTRLGVRVQRVSRFLLGQDPVPAPLERHVTKPIELIPDPSRRTFCAHACKAASLVAIGGLAACGGSQTSPSGSTATPAPSVSATLTGRVVSIALDSATALSAVGSAAIVQTAMGSFLVAHTGADTYTALSSTCTHEACVVTGFQDGRYVCPCHGSQYSTSGAVIAGPAPRALTQFPTQVTGTVLSFTV
jgi:cytochrome b6-f complex iron-sulfur subunit